MKELVELGDDIIGHGSCSEAGSRCCICKASQILVLPDFMRGKGHRNSNDLDFHEGLQIFLLEGEKEKIVCILRLRNSVRVSHDLTASNQSVWFFNSRSAWRELAMQASACSISRHLPLKRSARTALVEPPCN